MSMAATQTEAILLSAREDGVLKLTLNRPEARNALSADLIAALQEALDGAAKDETARVVVLAANGSAFCGGHDLKEMQAHRNDFDKGAYRFHATFNECSTMMKTIVYHPLPVIAQVQGMATAAGCQLVASCDLAVATTEAKFATPGVNIGLFCSTPMVALSRNLSRKHAMEMLLTGDMVDSRQAKEIGLVNRVVAPEKLVGETMAFARKIASKPRATVKFGKEAFYRQLEMSLSDAYDYASEIMTRNMMHAEAKEGICAFVEKRDPKWPG
ncbi:MAG: enoyl-CoA hydratase [Alphaproteobacteria bacterium]